MKGTICTCELTWSQPQDGNAQITDCSEAPEADGEGLTLQINPFSRLLLSYSAALTVPDGPSRAAV